MPNLSTQEIRAKIADGSIFAISVDTAVFDKFGCNLEYAVLRKLDQFMSGPIAVLISEIVVNEVRSHIARDAHESQRKLEKAIKDQRKRWKRTVDLKSLPTELALTEDPKKAAKSQVEEFLQAIGARVVAATALDVTGELLRRYFAVEAPFESNEKKRHEFPDAFALLSLEALAKQRQKLLLCVTPDKGWKAFAEASEYIVVEPDPDVALSFFNESGRMTADKVMDLWKRGVASDLNEEVDRAFEYRLDDVDFIADGSSGLEFESEPTGAVMQWVDPKTASHPLVIAADDRTVTFTVEIDALVAFDANFSFYVKDGVDRDYISLGSEPFSVEKKKRFQLAITVLRDLDADDRIVEVEVSKKQLEVNFGFIEPFRDENPTHEKY